MKSRKSFLNSSYIQHAQALLKMLEVQCAQSRQFSLPVAYEKIKKAIPGIKRYKHYQQCLRWIESDLCFLLGIKGKLTAQDREALLHIHYWMQRQEQNISIRTTSGNAIAQSALTSAQCFEWLSIFAQDSKKVPAWFQALGRVERAILKKSLIYGISPILPLADNDLSLFWESVDEELNNRRELVLRTSLKSKKMRLNHLFRKNPHKDVQAMIELLPSVGFIGESYIKLSGVISYASSQQLNEERLSLIWEKENLRTVLVEAIGRQIGVQPAWEALARYPGLRNVWAFVGNDKTELSTRITMAHPIPEIENKNAERLGAQNIEQLMDIVGKVRTETGPILMQSLISPLWPDLDGDMYKRCALLKLVEKHQDRESPLWLVTRPTGTHAILSKAQESKSTHLEKLLIWARAALEEMPIASAKHALMKQAILEYQKAMAHLFQLQKRYQLPVIGDVLQRLALMRGGEQFQTLIYQVASYEQIILSLGKGTCITFCENGRDKALISLWHTEAMLLYHQKYKKFPDFQKEDDKKVFARLFAKLPEKQDWIQALILNMQPAKGTLVALEERLPIYLREALIQYAPNFMNKQSQLNDWHHREHHEPEILKNLLIWCPTGFDLHLACQRPEIKHGREMPKPKTYSTLPSLSLPVGNYKAGITSEKPSGIDKEPSHDTDFKQGYDSIPF